MKGKIYVKPSEAVGFYNDIKFAPYWKLRKVSKKKVIPGQIGRWRGVDIFIRGKYPNQIKTP